MSDKEVLEKLSNPRDQAINIIKEYNILARDNNQNTRMAYATASSYYDEEEDDDGNKVEANFERIVKASWGENVGVSISSPEADYWFPSSICN